MRKLCKRLTRGTQRLENDIKHGLDLYERSMVEAGKFEVMYRLARVLTTGADGVEKDVRRAVELLEALLVFREDDQDNVWPVKFQLGRILEDGAKDVEKDVKRAMKLYEEEIADHDGHNNGARLRLAGILQNGAEGVEKDVEKARGYYLEIINHDENERMQGMAMVQLAVILLTEGLNCAENAGERAVHWLKEAIYRGIDSASLIIAWLFRTGAGGNARNVTQAMEFLEGRVLKERAVNDHLFLLNIGMMLLSLDVGSLRDPDRAKTLLLRSISIKPTLLACTELGNLCYGGDVGVRDVEKAREMFRLIAELSTFGSDEKEIEVCMQDPATHPHGRWV